MQIKIEIDVKPEELRRFLGLPDVAGLQEDVVRFLRDKVSSASEGFDAAGVVQGSLDLIRRNPAWQLLRSTLSPRERREAAAADEAAAAVLKPRRRKAHVVSDAPAKKQARRASKAKPGAASE